MIMKHYVLPLVILLILSISCQRSINQTVAFFGVNLKGIEYEVVDQYDRWIPFNGNGECYLRLSLSKTNDDNINRIAAQMIDKGARQLPLKERDIIIPGRLRQYYSSNDGLYVLKVDNNDARDYYLLILDEALKEILIQIHDE